uniref:Uncharacterized protein n=1 Tax=Arundo donax TaxID=35708 RepID=A0A0A8Y4N7_ARUDO
MVAHQFLDTHMDRATDLTGSLRIMSATRSSLRLAISPSSAKLTSL